MRIHFAIAVVVLVMALIVDVTKIELIALLISITFVLIAEMLNTAVEARDRHRDDVVRPDGEAREGHRRRRGADRDDQRDRRRLPRVLGQGRRPLAPTCSTACATRPPS